MTQAKAPLGLHREVLEGPVGSSWGASPTGVLPAHTHQGRSLHTERSCSPGKLGVCVYITKKDDVLSKVEVVVSEA